MVEKVSVNIKIIALNIEHSFLIPWEMSTAEATALVVQALCEEYPGVRKPSMKEHLLMQASTGKILNQTCNFKQLGIIQGEKLLLI